MLTIRTTHRTRAAAEQSMQRVERAADTGAASVWAVNQGAFIQHQANGRFVVVCDIEVKSHFVESSNYAVS